MILYRAISSHSAKNRTVKHDKKEFCNYFICIYFNKFIKDTLGAFDADFNTKLSGFEEKLNNQKQEIKGFYFYDDH